MSKRKAANSAAASRRGRRPGVAGPALALLALAWAGAPGDVRADTIVLKSGEVLEGSIIDATRNTVVVQRSIGGMRQMSIREIEEVRIELAQGQQVSGQLLSWAEGVYQVRSGGQVLRISEGDILSREPSGPTTTAQAPTDPPPRPVGKQTVRMAAAPATSAPEETAAREQMATQTSKGEDQSPAADQDESPAAGEEQALAAGEDQTGAADQDQSAATGEAESLAAGDDQTPAADQDQSPATGEEQRLAASEDQSPAADQDESPAAGEEESLAADQDESSAAGEEQALAAIEDQSPATGENQSLAIKASAEPGADTMVFRIELSRPAEQTVVLIYGTVEGTAKAGEDFEPQQGMVTLAPGSKSAEVHVPLLEHPSSQGEKRFELFLTADPKVAEVVDRRVIATINGDD
jgi:Calx-beta domain